jgi:hypothetical protein
MLSKGGFGLGFNALNLVSILVLMDYALEAGRKTSVPSIRSFVSILVLMDYALEGIREDRT